MLQATFALRSVIVVVNILASCPALNRRNSMLSWSWSGMVRWLAVLYYCYYYYYLCTGVSVIIIIIIMQRLTRRVSVRRMTNCRRRYQQSQALWSSVTFLLLYFDDSHFFSFGHFICQTLSAIGAFLMNPNEILTEGQFSRGGVSQPIIKYRDTLLWAVVLLF